MLRPVILAVLLVCTFWVSQKLIYEPIIVPKLGTLKAVPMALWVATLVPELLVCAMATSMFRRFSESLVFCLVGGFAVTSAQFFAGLFNLPGHHKIIEGGFLQFPLQFVLITTALAIVVAILAAVRFGLHLVRSRCFPSS